MARKGKIARLPFAVREEINRRLLDNENGVKLVAWINTTQQLRDAAAITEQNLSEWRGGGFDDWLKNQDKVQRTKDLAEYCLRVAKAGGGSMDLPAAIAGGHLMEVLEDFDPKDLKDMIKEDPKNYIELITSLSKLQRSKADEAKARQGDVKLEQSERALKLAEGKFQVQTCELFLKWFTNKKAEEIAADKSMKPAVKVEQLRQLMFGEVENAEG